MGILETIDKVYGTEGDEFNKKILSKLKKDFKDFEEITGKDILKDLEGEVEEEKDFEKAIKSFTSKLDLAKKFIEILPVYYDDSGLWWIWNKHKHKWELKDDITILNLIDETSSADVINSKQRQEIINSLKQIGRRNKPKEIKKSWIQFKDKIIDIETGEKFDASPEYFVTNPIPHKLGSKPDTPIMDKIFEEWVGPDYVKTLYEILAYSLISDYPIHRLFCFYGSGLNGKSCYLRLLKKFVGDENCAASELDILLKSRFEITRLYKKLVCQMGETNFGELNKTSVLKKLTGQDTIGFEYKNKTPFEGFNYAKILISTNNLPPTTDKTLGFYRRWLIIDFPNQFDEKKDILATIPDKEYESLSLKCVNLLIDLLKKREFSNEGDIEDRIRRYEDRSDPLQKFLDENVNEDVEGHIWKGEFYKKLCGWLKENRFREIAENTIGRRMKEKGFEQKQIYADWFNDGKGGNVRAWIGLKWKE